MLNAAQFRLIKYVSFIVIGCLATAPVQAGALQDVRSSGVLQCGVDAGVEGFSSRLQDGTWVGLPVNFCRALALATIGDASKVIFTQLNAAERVEALQSGEVDVLVSAQPIAPDIESRDGLLFSEPLFHNQDKNEDYAAAVRQGDDEWFVAVRWLQKLLTLHPNKDDAACAAFDAVTMLEKNWACRVLKQYADDAWKVKAP